MHRDEKGMTLLYTMLFLTCTMSLSAILMTRLRHEGDQMRRYQQEKGYYILAKQCGEQFVEKMNAECKQEVVQIPTPQEQRMWDYLQREPDIYRVIEEAEAFLKEGKRYFTSEDFFSHQARIQEITYTFEQATQQTVQNKMYLNHSSNHDRLIIKEQLKCSDYKRVKDSMLCIRSLFVEDEAETEKLVSRYLAQYVTRLEEEFSKPYQFVLVTTVQQQALEVGYMGQYKERVVTVLRYRKEEVEPYQIAYRYTVYS